MFLKIPKYYLEHPNLRANFLFLLSCYTWVGFFMDSLAVELYFKRIFYIFVGSSFDTDKDAR